jgi:predicted RNase H-like HicB family nuclease
MLTDFIYQKLKLARYKILDDGQYWGEVPRLQGVWATGENLEECREELQEVLEEWLVLKIKDGDKIPGFPAKISARVHIPNKHQGDISAGLVNEVLRQASIKKKDWDALK